MTRIILQTDLNTSFQSDESPAANQPIELSSNLASLSTYSLQKGYEQPVDLFLNTSFDPQDPFHNNPASQESLLLSPVSLDERDEDFHFHFDEKPIRGFRRGWKPDDWQLSLSTRYFFTDNMAGFYNDGIHVNGLHSDGYGNHTVVANGFSSAYGSPPIALELDYVRKQQMFKVDGVGADGHAIIKPVVGGFESKGPSFHVGLSYQNNHFSDLSYEMTLNDRQLLEILDETGYEIGNSFNEDFPIGDISDFIDISQYTQEIQDWLNSRFNNMPDIIRQGFSDYDLSDDLDTGFVTGSRYNVPTFKLDSQMCVGDSVWRYDKRVNFFHSGKVCLEGSAIYFGGNHFADNFYLGVGPYIEFTVLSYHQKPFRKLSYYGLDKQKDFIPPSVTLSTFVYAEGQYFNAFNLGEGYYSLFDEQNRFVTANLGVGLRTTIPSFSKRRVPKEPPSEPKKKIGDFLDNYYENAPDFGIEDLALSAK